MHTLKTALLSLALAAVASAGEVLSVSPDAGTFGTRVTLGLDGDPGPKKPGAYLERLSDGKRFKLKVVEFDDEADTVLVEVRKQKKLTAGFWSIVVQPKGKPKREPFVADAAFELVPPTILSISPDTVMLGDVVTLTVDDLGTRKCPVKVAGKKAKRLSWDPQLGQVVIRLPKQRLPATGAAVSILSPLGTCTLLDALTIVDGTQDEPGGGPFTVGGMATAVESARHALDLVPGSTAYAPTVFAICAPNAAGEERVLLMSFENPHAPHAADSMVDAPTHASFQIGKPETPAWRAWRWKPGDDFDLIGKPVGDGTITWLLSCKLSLSTAGKPPLKISGTFVSEDLNGPFLTEGPIAALVLDGQTIDLDEQPDSELSIEFYKGFDDTTVAFDLTFEIGGVCHTLYAWADRDGLVDPMDGPLVFSASEITVDLYNDNSDDGWGSEAGPLGNLSFYFAQVPCSSLLELTVVATLPGPGGPRTVHARVLADRSDWEW